LPSYRPGQGFLIDLARFAETRGWLASQEIEQTERLSAPVDMMSEQALDACWKKVSKRARKLEQFNEEQCRELRMALEKQRNLVGFFSSLLPVLAPLDGAVARSDLHHRMDTV
jgi:triphosphatase